MWQVRYNAQVQDGEASIPYSAEIDDWKLKKTAQEVLEAPSSILRYKLSFAG